VPGAPTLVYRDGLLHCEDVSLEDLYRTIGPAYVYSGKRLTENATRVRQAFSRAPTLIAYAVKANTNPILLRLFYEMGLGFEVSSGSELSIALAGGASPDRVVVNGNARTDDELVQVAESGAYLISIDSEEEAVRLEAAAAWLEKQGRLTKPVRAALRVNPDVDAHVHPDLATGIAESKFGLPPDRVLAWYAHPEWAPHLKWVGIHVHVGSQIMTVEPLLDTLGECVDLIERVRSRGPRLEVLNLGGGFGVNYDGKGELALERFADAACLVANNQRLQLVVEPGRFLVADTCALVGQVLFVKRGKKAFAVTELGMNDLIRPALYDAHHAIVPVREPEPRAERIEMDVVGPVCESGDYLAQRRKMPPLEPGDLLAVTGAGAYGYTMASNYNGRGRLPEALVSGKGIRLIRRGESWKDLIRMASDLPIRISDDVPKEHEPPAASASHAAPTAPARPGSAIPVFRPRAMADAVAEGLRRRKLGREGAAEEAHAAAPAKDTHAASPAKGTPRKPKRRH